MEKFCKLYETDDIGQVLVMLAEDNDGSPSVRINFKPPHLGVCHIDIGFPDTDEGWDKQLEAFDNITEESATEVARKSINKLSEAGL